MKLTGSAVAPTGGYTNRRHSPAREPIDRREITNAQSRCQMMSNEGAGTERPTTRKIAIVPPNGRSALAASGAIG
jgi:hypothetical protein